jgi:hypothetical protein
MTKKRFYIAIVFVLIFLVGVLAVRFGEHFGQEHALLAKARLDLIFGDVLLMPEIDRALFASMSLQCRLAQRPNRREDTIQCLREASLAPDLPRIPGMTNPPLELQRSS